MTDATIAPAGPDHRAAFRASTFADVLRSEWTKSASAQRGGTVSAMSSATRVALSS